MSDKESPENQEKNDPELTRVVEEVIDKGATTAEEIHRAVGELPIAVLENLGMDEAATGVKKSQDRSIGTICKLIRTVNHEVADLAADLLEQRQKLDRKDDQ